MECLNAAQMELVAGGQSVSDAGAMTGGGAASGGLGAVAGMPAGSALGDVAAAGTIGSVAGAGLGLEAYMAFQAGTAIYNAYDVQIGDFIDSTVGFLGSVF